MDQCHLASALTVISTHAVDVKNARGKTGPSSKKIWHQSYVVRDMPIDDTQLKMLIQETLVLAEKDYSRWNWDLIGEVFSSYLHHPTYLVDVLRTTSFVKRVLAFYRPSANQFCDLLMNRSNLRFLTIGCDVITALTTGMDGVKYLYESGLFNEIGQYIHDGLLVGI